MVEASLYNIYITDTKLPVKDEDRTFAFHYIDGIFTANFPWNSKRSLHL